MKLIRKMSMFKHEKDFVKSLFRVFLFDVLLYILWIFFILKETYNNAEFFALFILALGLLPLMKLYLCLKLHMDLKGAEEKTVTNLQQEMIDIKKEQAINTLDTLKSFYKQGKHEEAKAYMNEHLCNDVEMNVELTDCICMNLILSHYNQIAKKHNIKFIIECPKEIHKLNERLGINKKALNTILGNYMDNGIEALRISNKKDKIISIQVLKGNDYIIYRVSNNGKKINNVSKVFEPKYSTKGCRRGFGLVAVKKIVESLNGHINVSSTDYETSFEVVVSQ